MRTLGLLGALVAMLAFSARALAEPAELSCKKLPPGKNIKLNLKPDTEIADLIALVSRITCTPFLVPSAVQMTGKKVTVLSPPAMTVAETERLLYAALDSVGLTAQPSGKLVRIVPLPLR
jgi:general secretion pathway protein D